MYDSKQHHALKALSHGAIFLANFNAILLLSKGGSSRYSGRFISRKLDVTMGTVSATKRRRREHPGGGGGSGEILTKKSLKSRALEMRFPAFGEQYLTLNNV